MSDTLSKKLLFQSLHRGCKENDIILGDYATQKLHHMDMVALELYQDFLMEDDTNIYNWVSKREAVPARYTLLVIDLQNFLDGTRS